MRGQEWAGQDSTLQTQTQTQTQAVNSDDADRANAHCTLLETKFKMTSHLTMDFISGGMVDFDFEFGLELDNINDSSGFRSYTSRIYPGDQHNPHPATRATVPYRYAPKA
eukprot:jgi/Psemu1/16267/gm1.16267_g